MTSKIKDVFQTSNDLYILTSSGTGALESAVVNTISPGDSVLSISVGVFGDRFSQIAHMYGADVTDLKRSDRGKTVDRFIVSNPLEMPLNRCIRIVSSRGSAVAIGCCWQRREI